MIGVGRAKTEGSALRRPQGDIMPAADIETSVPSPKCPTCDVRMNLNVLVPRDDGGGEWRFSCPVCKVTSVVITKP